MNFLKGFTDADKASEKVTGLVNTLRTVALSDNRPSIYEEAMEMLTGALIIYIYADVRALAREGELKVTATTIEELEPPMTGEEMLERIKVNGEALAKRAIDHSELEKKLADLSLIGGTSQGGSFMNLFKADRQASKLTNFVDDKGRLHCCATDHLPVLLQEFLHCVSCSLEWLLENSS